MTLLACGSRQALTAVTADLEHRRRWVLINGAVATESSGPGRYILRDQGGVILYEASHNVERRAAAAAREATSSARAPSTPRTS